MSAGDIDGIGGNTGLFVPLSHADRIGAAITAAAATVGGAQPESEL